MKPLIDNSEDFGPCDKCGQGRMVKRYSRKNNQDFLGCSSFPACRNTKPFPRKQPQISIHKPNITTPDQKEIPILVPTFTSPDEHLNTPSSTVTQITDLPSDKIAQSSVIKNQATFSKPGFDQEALIRAIGVSPGKYMLLLGAGASASSGVPTASQCIWEWKKEIYLSSNSKLSPRLILDVNLPHIQRLIQEWIDKQGRFPKLGDDGEYGFYIQYTYPDKEDRRKFFESRVSKSVPHVGYLALALLLNYSKIKYLIHPQFLFC